MMNLNTIRHTISLLLLVPCLGTWAQTTLTLRADSTDEDVTIEMPHGMTVTCDSLLSSWHAQAFMESDTGCNMQDVNPYFEQEVYVNRLRRLPTAMEMAHNAVVQRFIDQYSGKLRHSVAYMLGAGNFYIPLFEEALDLYQLPLELKYLPVIESALDPCAVSRAGAVGLWQFMLPTAKRYGLKINSLIDERRDPVRSTYAAAAYLKDLYNIFHDWNLVIAAYNCGPDNVNKAIHRAGGERDYWQIYPYLPRETRGYVPAFIAANYIMNYYCEHNICPMRARVPLATDTVMVSRELHLRQVAEVCRIDMEELQALNPQYRTDLVPGLSEPCALRLPRETVMAFIDAGETVYTHRADELLTRRETVEVNEDMAPKPATRTSTRRSHRTTRTRQKSVTIRSGQTLSEIARKNGTTVSRLKALNRISGSNIRAGRKLRVR